LTPRKSERKLGCAQPEYALTMTKDEKEKADKIITKYIDKFFKIYTRLNVKVVSLQILKTEIDVKNPLLMVLDRVSGHLNKVNHQIKESLDSTDNEIQKYKNIITKLRSQIEFLE
jgi:hypothetical protein